MKKSALPTALLAVLVFFQLASIVIGNGRLAYSLDDAYIHLTLAESIAEGTYGINAGESSSPSSSILWPFLLVPMIPFAVADWWPLLLATAAAFGSLAVYRRLLRTCGGALDDEQPLQLILLLLLIPGTSLVGLLFTGMEHSLHQLVTALAVLGAVQEIHSGRASRWLWFVLFLGPMVRFEGLAVSVPILLFLLMRGHRRAAILTGVAIAAGVGAFAGFLVSLGLAPLPASVSTKSLLFWQGISLASLGESILTNLGGLQGDFLAIAGLLLLTAGLRKSRPAAERWLATCSFGSVALHLVFGKLGWYHRYEAYIWTFAVLMLIYLFRETLKVRLETDGLGAIALALILLTALSCRGYLRALVTTPQAATNIYEQHYQMHRFVTEHLQAPVAVNDIGWVAYRNPHYVLDVFGLASTDVLKARREGGTRWIADLVQSHGVECAMIYNRWYEIPRGWVKLAELEIQGELITPAFKTVTIYATQPAAARPILAHLLAWQQGLPDPEMLTITVKPPI